MYPWEELVEKGHAHQRSPRCRANGKPEHIDRDTRQEDFGAAVELVDDFNRGFGVCRGGEGDDEDRHCGDESNEPLSGVAPVHGIVRVIVLKFDNEGILLGAPTVVDIVLLQVASVRGGSVWLGNSGWSRHDCNDVGKSRGRERQFDGRVEVVLPYQKGINKKSLKKGKVVCQL